MFAKNKVQAQIEVMTVGHSFHIKDPRFGICQAYTQA